MTGASGLLGGWLTRALLARRADVVCLVRDWVPQCELVRTGMLEQVMSGRFYFGTGGLVFAYEDSNDA